MFLACDSLFITLFDVLFCFEMQPVSRVKSIEGRVLNIKNTNQFIFALYFFNQMLSPNPNYLRIVSKNYGHASK